MDELNKEFRKACLEMPTNKPGMILTEPEHSFLSGCEYIVATQNFIFTQQIEASYDECVTVHTMFRRTITGEPVELSLDGISWLNKKTFKSRINAFAKYDANRREQANLVKKKIIIASKYVGDISSANIELLKESGYKYTIIEYGSRLSQRTLIATDNDEIAAILALQF